MHNSCPITLGIKSYSLSGINFKGVAENHSLDHYQVEGALNSVNYKIGTGGKEVQLFKKDTKMIL